MSTLFYEHTPFDILYRNFFKADEAFAPALISIEMESDVLRISYDKPKDDTQDLSGYIYHGLSKKSFSLGYKIAPKFDLTKIDAEMENGLLKISIPLTKEAKPKTIKIK